MSPLPFLFMLLASTALLGALVALWNSLRSALTAAAVGGVVEALGSDELPDRAALIDEKKSLLRAIKDLEYEHAVGKIAEEDFGRLNQAYRVRAKEVLALLEQDLVPYTARAEALLAGASAAAEIAAPKAKKRKVRSESEEPEPEEPAEETSQRVSEKRSEKATESALRDRARALREEAERLESLAAATLESRDVSAEAADEAGEASGDIGAASDETNAAAGAMANGATPSDEEAS